MTNLEALLCQANRILEGQSRVAEFTTEAVSFGPQRWLIESPHRRKVAKCGRRSGKTVGVAIALLLAALEQPVVPVLYVTLTRGNAKDIVWRDLLRLNREFGLGFTVREADLELVSPIGVVIQLRGAHTAQEIEKYRGKAFKLVIIDEAQSFPDTVLRPLIQDVIGPTLLDYSGALWLVGTPPPLRRGYFFECYAGKLAAGREIHHWTVRDNERFPARLAGKSVDQILADVRAEFGWTEEDPTYRREYLGEDVEDLEALLFEYIAARNGVAEPEGGEWTNVLALDLGHDDNSALSVEGWRKGDRRVWHRAEWRDNKVDVTDCVNKLVEFRALYRPVSMVIDTGGLGKMIAAEIRRRHQIPVEPAEKNDKPGAIKLWNTAMRKGQYFAAPDSLLVEEFGLVRKDPDALARGKLQELGPHDGGYHGNMTDASLYAWRKCWAHLEKIPEDKPPEYQEPTELTKRLLAEQKRERAALSGLGLV